MRLDSRTLKERRLALAGDLPGEGGRAGAGDEVAETSMSRLESRREIGQAARRTRYGDIALSARYALDDGILVRNLHTYFTDLFSEALIFIKD
ncbi:hypothetical protein [Trinickia fusca]|uniref:hypothetical protein n=1 Tax=Trinickia fusca TaxID=2419777 RepID=UPI00160411A4|nr:hypothetical protein [Trinickia fusca]